LAQAIFAQEASNAPSAVASLLIALLVAPPLQGTLTVRER
jgi:hypothetical protein